MTEKRFTIYTDQIDHWTIVGLDLLQELTGRRLIVADIENILNGLYNENIFKVNSDLNKAILGKIYYCINARFF